MEQTLRKFARVLRDPYGQLGDWKKTNRKKIIGCFPMYAPEEIIHAAGMLPVTLLTNEETITLGDKHLMVNACEQVRGCFDMLLKGQFDVLDGVVFVQICDQIRFFADVWQLDHPFPFFHQIWLPPKQDSNARSFLIHELNRFKTGLEEFAGKEITFEALERSFRLYNENRSLLRKLYELRREKPDAISAGDMVGVVAAGLLMPKEEHNTLLQELIVRLEGLKPQQDGRVRLIAVGHNCAIPDVEVLNLIEEAGGLVLNDDFYVGGRYAAPDIGLTGDPIESLAGHLMEMNPCVTKHYPAQFLDFSKTSRNYSDFIVDMVRENRAEGVVFLRVMYCDPYDFEFIMVQNRLTKEGIPFLPLITEHGTGSLGSVRTRLQAFLEILEEKRK